MNKTIKTTKLATIDTTNPRPSTCLPRTGAMDVDVLISHPALGNIEGEVTLVPNHDGNLAAYAGEPSHWISGPLLRRMIELPDADFRDLCDEIETAAVVEAEAS